MLKSIFTPSFLPFCEEEVLGKGYYRRKSHFTNQESQSTTDQDKLPEREQKQKQGAESRNTEALSRELNK